MEFEKDEIDVQLGFIVGEDGLYSISALNLINLVENGFTCVELNDSKTGISYVLDEEHAYVFNATKEDNIKRFSLHLSKKSRCLNKKIITESKVDFLDGNDEVFVRLLSGDDVNSNSYIEVYDMLGNIVGSKIAIGNSTITQVPIPTVNSCYLVYVTLNNQVYKHKYLKH